MGTPVSCIILKTKVVGLRGLLLHAYWRNNIDWWEIIWQCSVALAQLPGTRDAVGIWRQKSCSWKSIKHCLMDFREHAGEMRHYHATHLCMAERCLS